MNNQPDMWPKEIGNPARQALVAAGLTQIKQLTNLSEKDLLAFHGVGPKAIRILKQLLTDQGLSFKS